MKNQPIICLLGPTASGKTDLACRLVDELNGEIVSVDSAMIYRGMDVGTATPDRLTLKQYPHHLIDLIDPAERYSVARFIEDAQRAIDQIQHDGKCPILAGGTMMYFHCLQNGLSDLPKVSSCVEQVLLKQLTAGELPALYAELQKVDPCISRKIKSNDQQRILRALAVYRCTGTPLSHWQQNLKAPALPNTVNIVLCPQSREVLHQRIADRFRLMLQQDFLQEVEVLYRRGDLSIDTPSMRCVGYRQVWQYLDGNLDYDEMVERAIIATRQLAKRQQTWLRRRWSGAVQLDASDPHAISRCLNAIQREFN